MKKSKDVPLESTPGSLTEELLTTFEEVKEEVESKKFLSLSEEIELFDENAPYNEDELYYCS